jgi:hypothetical protein
MKRQLDAAAKESSAKDVELKSLRAQTMRLAVDCGKLQLRLRGVTPGTSGASSPQVPGSPVVVRSLPRRHSPGVRVPAATVHSDGKVANRND